MSQIEIEQIFFRHPLIVVPDMKHSASEPRFHALGRTEFDRWLQVTSTLRAGGTLIRPISARDMQRKERRIYEQTIEEDS